MIGKRMQEAINEQIQHELGSAYLYLAMAADFHAKGLDGMAQWMKVQAQEEMTHAMRFFDHIRDRGGHIELKALAAPESTWPSPLAAFQAAYKHEQFITARIDELTKIAREENDNAALFMLQWFVNEQVEEEANASKIVDMLTLIGESGHGLLMADRELGARVFTPPAAEPGAA
ncbi:MAG: ferritin [Candidatus Bipolaricaulota bacterium]